MSDHVSGAPVGAIGWVEFKCRCPDCKDAYHALGATPRERRINGPTPSWVHGTWGGYSNYSCRCAQCLQACREKYEYGTAWRRANRELKNERQREYRLRKKEEEQKRDDERRGNNKTVG
jgi:hypothetical protein